jgi:hypothetical protein
MESDSLTTQRWYEILSTDHELIPERNASLAAMQGSASGSRLMFVTIKRGNIRPSKEKIIRTYSSYNARCLQLGYESLRRLIAGR